MNLSQVWLFVSKYVNYVSLTGNLKVIIAGECQNKCQEKPVHFPDRVKHSNIFIICLLSLREDRNFLQYYTLISNVFIHINPMYVLLIVVMLRKH